MAKRLRKRTTVSSPSSSSSIKKVKKTGKGKLVVSKSDRGRPSSAEVKDCRWCKRTENEVDWRTPGSGRQCKSCPRILKHEGLPDGISSKEELEAKLLPGTPLHADWMTKVHSRESAVSVTDLSARKAVLYLICC